MTISVLIVGSGAMATLFAGRLSAVGVSVSMLGSWLEALAALRSSGAQLEGEGAFQVQATDATSEACGAKLALVMVKSWQTERAATQLADCLAEDGLAVTFQNGLGNKELLCKVLGKGRVSQGITTIGAALRAPGIVRASGRPLVTLEDDQEGVRRLETILRTARFEVNMTKDLLPFVWGKLVINSAINPLTALLRLKNGEIPDNLPARQVLGELARETGAVAEALGVALPFSDPEKAAVEVAQQTAENSSSMLQDVLRGARTEIDAINGAVVRMGRQTEVSTPVNQVVWSLVKALSGSGAI